MWTLLVGLSFADQAHRITDPLRSQAFVADEAGILDAPAEQRMNVLLGALHQDRGTEVLVVTVPKVEDGTPKQLTTQLFELWGIGDPDTNTGLLVLLAVAERRIEMEPGYGLEPVMSDAWLGALQRQKMVPYLREDQWAEGLQSGLAVVDAQLRLKADQVTVGVPARTFSQQLVLNLLALPWHVTAIMAAFVGLLFWMFVDGIKRRFFLTAEERAELASMPPGTNAQEQRARRQEILRRRERYQQGHSGGSGSGYSSAPRSRGGGSGGGGAGSSF